MGGGRRGGQEREKGGKGNKSNKKLEETQRHSLEQKLKERPSSDWMVSIVAGKYWSSMLETTALYRS